MEWRKRGEGEGVRQNDEGIEGKKRAKNGESSRVGYVDGR